MKINFDPFAYRLAKDRKPQFVLYATSYIVEQNFISKRDINLCYNLNYIDDQK